MRAVKHYDLKLLKYDRDGLIPAVVQDVEDGTVLMVAYMNETALRKTLDSGRVFFWSRSRRKLWAKGETSGHIQVVREIRVDCDKDTILIKAEQRGGACHEGYRTCFFRRLRADSDQLEIVEDKVFDPDQVYKS